MEVMVVHEWSVMITDALLAAACFAAIWESSPKLTSENRAGSSVLAGLFFVGMAAVLGSIRHGLGPDLSGETYRNLWHASYVLIIAADAVITWGFIRGIAYPGWQAPWGLFTFLRVMLVTWFFLGISEVGIVIGDWVVTMIVLFSLAILALYRHWRPLGLWLGATVVICVLAGLFHAGLWVGNHGTLHDDVSHLVQIPSILCFAYIVRHHLHDQSQSPS